LRPLWFTMYVMTLSAMVLRQILPVQMNNIFIINENPPEMLMFAPFCCDLPTINFVLRLLNLSQNEQNAANRGKPGT